MNSPIVKMADLLHGRCAHIYPSEVRSYGTLSREARMRFKIARATYMAFCRRHNLPIQLVGRRAA